MRFVALIGILSVFSFGSLPGVLADEGKDIEVHRLSERVIVLTENSPVELNVTAIASEAGIVVVDTTYSPVVAGKIRERIEREFGRSDLSYVINTHHHWDHWFGNQVFAGATFIAHETAPGSMRRTATPRDGGPHPAPWLLENARRERAQLEQLDPDSSQAESLRKRIPWFEKTHQELAGFEMTLPTITFSDRLSIDLGDMTVNVYYYGQADTVDSIVVHVPEEKLFCAGDLYWPGGVCSDFDDGLTLGITKWIEVLDTVLADEESIENVVCGHKSIWPRRYLELRRDYIVDLWNGVKAAQEEGLNLEGAKARLSSEKYAYMDELQFDERLKEMDIPKEILPELAFSRQHVRNIETFWRQLQESVAAVFEQTIGESGLEAALARYDEIKADSSDKYYFEENALNALGYRLMNSGQIDAAIAVFEINVEQFPESWNVYDSLAEGYLNDQQIELSLENYKKSLELNPENRNASNWIAEIESDNAYSFLHETRKRFHYARGENTGLQGPYLGQEPPGIEPKLFAPGLISTGGAIEFSSTFTPDGREYYFNRGTNIMVCYRTENGWTAPDFAPFNTQALDHESHITADGGKLFFGSNRPRSGLAPGENPYGIWVMDRTESGWSEPRFHVVGMYVTTAADGTLYVTDVAEIAGGGVVRSRFAGGRYAEMEKLGGGVNSPAFGIHPCIAPDESFIVFDSEREGGLGSSDLYICFRNEDGSWGEAVNLGDAINTEGYEMTASLSPDGKHLFYCTRRDIYWVSAEILNRLKPQ